MITINVIDDKICGSYGTTPFTVDYSKELYTKMHEISSKAEDITTTEEYNAIMEEFAPLCVVDYTKAIATKCDLNLWIKN